MEITGAIIKEQGVTFAVVVVKKQIIDDRFTAESTIESFQPIFSGLPVILMAQNSQGAPTYFGRKDISKFLSSIPANTIPWKKYRIN